jgi:thiol-disulfide isomerase/thioredoxin
VLLAVALAATMAACTSHTSSKAAAGTCLAPPVTAGASAAPLAAAATTGPGGGGHLPTARLACLDGTGDVELGAITQPTIVTLWASWCPPCQAELPELSTFAAANAGMIRVVGVDTADTRSAGWSIDQDMKLSFPSVADPDRKILVGVRRADLPVTLFVAPGGTIRAIWTVAGLTGADLADWSQKYLGTKTAA